MVGEPSKSTPAPLSAGARHSMHSWLVLCFNSRDSDMNHLSQVQLLLLEEFSQVGKLRDTISLQRASLQADTFEYSCLSRSTFTSQGPMPSGVKAVPATWATHHPHRRLTITNIPCPLMPLEVTLTACAIDVAATFLVHHCVLEPLMR